MYLHSLKAYSNSSSVLGNVKGGSSFFISSSKSILDSKSEEKRRVSKTFVIKLVAAFVHTKPNLHHIIT